MPDTPIPAAELAHAAAALRRLARAAATDRPPPWYPDIAGTVICPRPDGHEYVTGYTTPTGTAIAEYIAAVDPRLGEAVADWLAYEAEAAAHHRGATVHALAVARCLGGHL
ncbi:hypothetical protein AB0K71_05930 [Streptomyces syringium]|uniref:hypothetical protein n=1 Tax=Streptomyces syringium TaxID=76729 RepID=UPI0034250617